MTKIKIAIDDKDTTKLLGIDLSKISAFVYSGFNIEIWMDGAPEPMCIEKSSVQPQAFSQLLGALEEEFPELYGDEFPNSARYHDNIDPDEEEIPKTGPEPYYFAETDDDNEDEDDLPY